MLSSIPRRILRDTAIFTVPLEYDVYHTPIKQDTYTIRSVHLQADNTTVRRQPGTNDEVQLKGVLFVDARQSSPFLDLKSLQEKAQLNGGEMSCTVTTRYGAVYGPFTVYVVDALPDDEGNLHHYEIGLL